MLRVEKTTLGTFGEPELAGLINSRGWKSVLPDALDDQRLLLISDQLRDLLAGQPDKPSVQPDRVPHHLPSSHLEEPALLVLIMQEEDDFLSREDRLIVRGASWQIRVDERDDRLDTHRRVASNDGKQVFFLAIVQGLEHPVVIDEAGELLVQVRA